jgi:hypothetical protein
MAGNSKLGFMRGNTVDRNGVGTPKGFYCDSCDKEHGASVDRMGLNPILGNDVLVCYKKYFLMVEDKFKSKQDSSKAIAKLKRLKKKISLVDDDGLKARIDFISTLFMFELKDPLTLYKLYDEHHIGERDYDTCFEMYDGDLVIHGTIKQAKKRYWLKVMLKKALGVESFEYWMKTFARIEQSDQDLSETPTHTRQISFTL